MAKNTMNEEDFRKMLADNGYRVLEVTKGTAGRWTAIVVRNGWNVQQYEYRP